MPKERGNAPPEDFAETSNIYLAAFMLFKGCRITGVDKINPKKAVVYFQGKDAAYLEEEWYESNEKKYSDAYKTIKDRMF